MKRTTKRRSPVRFPNRLWIYRRRLGLSQRRVGEIVGYLTPSDISRFERGERLPSLVMALKFEILYGPPVGFLFPDLYARLREAIEAKRAAGRAEDCA